ncbi:hypothetical protein BP6252_12379 [Coleophoma cylindrospora]|uniref:60S ribosomal protein L20 n=1 Tax=Coleophoma cylindrospora TaxID=1849047 RepID=A0A3D8QGM7_9HELO|nr:hypothetical protein BP6252_12379 [Coleophoma cylindrospora]
MDVRVFRKPVCSVLSARTQCLFSLTTPTRRHQSSSRRSKKMLNIKPESSFRSTIDAKQDHIIFNPPSAAPSVLHTPLKFLPKNDKRRALLKATEKQKQANAVVPPVIEKFLAKWERNHLSEKDVEEMKKLRIDDPVKWRLDKLSEKFNCSMAFVKIISAELTYQHPHLREHAIQEREKAEAVKARWGKKRAMAREDRVKRLDLALKDA